MSLRDVYDLFKDQFEKCNHDGCLDGVVRYVNGESNYISDSQFKRFNDWFIECLGEYDGVYSTEEVLKEGGEGEGDHWRVVTKVTMDDNTIHYIESKANYSSWDGIFWCYGSDSFSLVEPYERVVIDYTHI